MRTLSTSWREISSLPMCNLTTMKIIIVCLSVYCEQQINDPHNCPSVQRGQTSRSAQGHDSGAAAISRRGLKLWMKVHLHPSCHASPGTMDARTTCGWKNAFIVVDVVGSNVLIVAEANTENCKECDSSVLGCTTDTLWNNRKKPCNVELHALVHWDANYVIDFNPRI